MNPQQREEARQWVFDNVPMQLNPSDVYGMTDRLLVSLINQWHPEKWEGFLEKLANNS